MKILIVDDERTARLVLRDLLAGLPDLELCEAADLTAARRILAEAAEAGSGAAGFDLALVDVRLGADSTNRDGLVLLEELRGRHPSVVTVVVSVVSEMAEIRRAMRAGAHDYILKDALCEELVLPLVEGVRQRRRLEREVAELRTRAALGGFPAGLVGRSAAMETLRATIRRVAMSDRPVLVCGPTGAGKELVVRAIHALGPSPTAPLVDLNCGAIPEQLMEAQLFGHERGAFTGADRRQAGLLAAAGKGVLFLDEIAELPLALQAKLLRVLETGRFRPVGAVDESRFEGRIVAATHADLADRVQRRQFREDLFYRLNVLTVSVPPLAARREDIPMLLAHFVAAQARRLRFSPEAVAVLSAQSWPGNVRQLRNLVDRLAVFADEDEVTPETLAGVAGAGLTTSFLAFPALPAEDQGGRPVAGAELQRSSLALATVARALLDQLPGRDPIGAIEEALIAEAMLRSGGRKTQAAELLGLHRKVIERRLAKPGGDQRDH